MNKNPEISVVMPVYNSEKFLTEAIESILNQTYKNFELLIVYDNSSDNSLSIIKKFQENDTRISLISGDKEGISGALNKGIELAKGKYIARMDSDDISISTRFEKQISHMQKLGLDICGGHSLLIDGNGKINGIGIMPRSHELCGLSMMFMVPFPHPSVMILKSFLMNNSLKYIGKYEDFDLWTRMFTLGAKFGNIDDIVIHYRQLEISLSTIHLIGARRYNRGVIKRFRLEQKHYLLNVIEKIDIRSLSEKEKSLVARYAINRALTRFDILILRKLKGISLKNIILVVLSEFQRLVTKFTWWSFVK